MALTVGVVTDIVAWLGSASQSMPFSVHTVIRFKSFVGCTYSGAFGDL